MSARQWTLYELEILMHHHSSSAPFPRFDAPIYGPTRNALYEAGLLESVDGITRTTDLGAALIQLILETPIPHRVWQDPRTGARIEVER